MKYPQLVHMPRDVELWLDKHLEARGIGAIACAKYLLSLIAQVNKSPPMEYFSCNSHRYDKYGNKRFLQAYYDRRSWNVDSLVVHYPMSTLREKCDIEKLVDELCVKLKEIENNGTAYFDVLTNFENTFPRTGATIVYSDEMLRRNLINTGEEAQPIPSCSPIWTRGLLHDSEPVKDKSKMEDYFSSLLYENPSDNLGFEFAQFKSDERKDGKERDRISFYNKQNLLASEGTERLYERNTDIDKLIAKFDANIQGIWKPPYENDDLGSFKYESLLTEKILMNPYMQSGSSLIWSFDQNENDYERNAKENIEKYKPNFSSRNKFSSPVLESNLGVNAVLNSMNVTLQKWSSIDGQNDESNVFLNHNRHESRFTEVVPKSNCTEQTNSLRTIHQERHKGNGDEEDLLTSAKTHFRPIRMEEVHSNQTVAYADGTTFTISNEFDKVTFTRSNSGILYLDADGEFDTPRKYMEYKESTKLFDSASDLSLMEEFVPKFRVRQSNEKCCQTEDIEDDQIVPSFNETDCDSDSYDCEGDDFFFPGDSELAENISDKMDDEEKMEFRKMTSDCNYNDIYVSGNAELLEKINTSQCVCGGGSAWLPLNEYEMRQEWGDIWLQENTDESCKCTGVGLPTKEEYFRFREELTQEGEQLLSDLSCLQQLYSSSKWEDDESETVSDFNEDENVSDTFCSSEFLNKFKCSIEDAGWKAFWLGKTDMSKSTSGEDVVRMETKLLKETEQNLNNKLNEMRERPFIIEKPQKEKKRRNSASQKMCSLYADGQTHRTHYRFSFCDPINPHVNPDTPRMREDPHELSRSLKRPLSF